MLFFMTGETSHTALSEKEQKNALLDSYLEIIAENIGSDRNEDKDAAGEAIAEIYRMTSSAVYGFALSILKNTHDSEDVLHDCYIHLYSSASSYHSSGKPMAWILTITRNLCMTKLREKKRRNEADIEDWSEYIEESGTLTTEERFVIRECMSTLSDDERQIVLLHALSGFKHREIAAMLSLPLPTVLSKYSRAIKKLKKRLSE